MATATQLADPAAAFVQGPHRLLVGGEWVETASGETFATIDPASGEEIAQVAFAQDEDIDKAVRAARAAFDEGPWTTKMTPPERAAVIYRVAELIEQNAEELAQ